MTSTVEEPAREVRGIESPPTSRSRSAPTWVAQLLLVMWKDGLIELRTGEVLLTSSFFALLVVVSASMAFYAGLETRQLVAAGTLWITLMFSAVLALGKTWQREREDRSIEVLLMTPLSRSAIFAGKTLALVGFLAVVELAVIPVVALFFSVDLLSEGLGVALVSALALPGIAATGTLFGAMTVRTRARDLVLAIVVFPLLAPSLLTAVGATRELFSGASLADIGDHLKLLAVFDVTFTAGGLAMFGSLIDG